MNVPQFQKLIFSWFQKNARVLPWREKIKTGKTRTTKKSLSLRDATLATYFVNMWRRDPYRVVVSELMLQQTQVDRVLSKFEEFIAKWPLVSDLAGAKLSDVLIIWQGLGYNRRARFLHEMAQAVMKKHGGKFPIEEAELRTLPGIGEYTARAILAFAYGKDVGVIDTNIQRIFARTFYGVEQTQVMTKLSVPREKFMKTVDSAVPNGKGDPWNQALMDFGAMVCIARLPKCPDCPLQDICAANLQAKKQGFENYAQKLAGEVANKKKSTTKKPPQNFHDTDRYFRGRVIDKLREGPIKMDKLWQHIHKNHGLSDKKRWTQLIEQLVKDKLLVVRGTVASLP